MNLARLPHWQDQVRGTKRALGEEEDALRPGARVRRRLSSGSALLSPPGKHGDLWWAALGTPRWSACGGAAGGTPVKQLR